MRVLTLNLWKNEGAFPDRLNLVTQGLLALAPDVVCLQEVYQDAGFNTLSYLDVPELCHRVQGSGREKQRKGLLSSSGLAILSRYPILAHSELDLPTSPSDGGRKVMQADIATPDGLIRVLSLHLSHLGGSSGSQLRAAQWEAILTYSGENWQGPRLFCGDFNEDVYMP